MTSGVPGSLVGEALPTPACPHQSRSVVSETERYALAILLASVAALAAVLLSRMTERIRIPAPLLMLVGAAVVGKLVPALQISDVVTVAKFEGNKFVSIATPPESFAPLAEPDHSASRPSPSSGG